MDILKEKKHIAQNVAKRQKFGQELWGIIGQFQVLILAKKVSIMSVSIMSNQIQTRVENFGAKVIKITNS